ncbi:MAG: GNAT family N-acetyltransferase [Acidimicrobiales bacterium]|jgi:GNAT superfamily N-acetyltransferase|nr:GNAT family N-acetyltransferase [Acidimicrobiales bacterium]MDP6297807.1 GNAT family N-acetyltransferase [Acidimicrobiales bacterium]HJM28982.1 GNAT family N-acetyltransferase [Acidimicrobiales bacterium]HJM97040.1 GNAT family N-acetyltransferase [Acidimicrobiales bacterium]
MQKLKKIPTILTSAFTSDPFMEWLFPGSEHQNNVQKWWEYITQASSKNANSQFGIDEENTTASIWGKPKFEKKKNGNNEDLNDFVTFLEPLVGERLPTVLQALYEVNLEHPDEPHWYLQAVGTIPSMQGKGKGATLLRPVLDICDATGLGAYLESSNPRNVSFYYRLGFEISKELILADGEASLTCMWRSPQSP